MFGVDQIHGLRARIAAITIRAANKGEMNGRKKEPRSPWWTENNLASALLVAVILSLADSVSSNGNWTRTAIVSICGMVIVMWMARDSLSLKFLRSPRKTAASLAVEGNAGARDYVPEILFAANVLCYLAAFVCIWPLLRTFDGNAQSLIARALAVFAVCASFSAALFAESWLTGECLRGPVVLCGVLLTGAATASSAAAVVAVDSATIESAVVLLVFYFFSGLLLHLFTDALSYRVLFEFVCVVLVGLAVVAEGLLV